jgi:hypothetical protein
MEPQITALAAILDLNTDLLLNTLEGVGDDEARVRLPGTGGPQRRRPCAAHCRSLSAL